MRLAAASATSPHEIHRGGVLLHNMKKRKAFPAALLVRIWPLLGMFALAGNAALRDTRK